MNKIKIIFWDFDGVIINSNKVSVMGFKEALKNYPTNEVNKLINYHNKNGGFSRYVKFNYFFEKIRKENISMSKIDNLIKKFSSIRKKNLLDNNLLIDETLFFIKKNYKKYYMHLISGSDNDELNYLCSELEIDKFFKSINGSPTKKTVIVKNLIKIYNYNKTGILFIGDSINDYNAATENRIKFYGFGNEKIKFYTNHSFKL